MYIVDLYWNVWLLNNTFSYMYISYCRKKLLFSLYKPILMETALGFLVKPNINILSIHSFVS